MEFGNDSAITADNPLQTKEIQQAFSLFDKNRDGSICLKELATLVRSLGLTPTEKEIRDVMMQIDVNMNGTVDYPEFVRVMQKIKYSPLQDMDLLQSFQVFDKDGNGFISIQEMREIMTGLGEPLGEGQLELMIREADTNKDGQVDYEEFIKLMT